MPADEARRMSGWHLPLAVSPVWGPVWSSPKAPPLLPSQRHTTRCPTRPRHHDQFDHDDQTSTAHSAIHTRTPWPPPCSHAHTHTRWSAGWCCWRESSPARFVPARTQSQLSVSREQDPPPCTCTRPTKSRAPALPIHSLHSLSLPYMPLLPRTAGQLGQQPSHQAGGALSPHFQRLRPAPCICSRREGKTAGGKGYDGVDCPHLPSATALHLPCLPKYIKPAPSHYKWGHGWWT